MNEKDFLLTPSNEDLKETVAADAATAEVKEAEIKEVVFEKKDTPVAEAPMSFLIDDTVPAVEEPVAEAPKSFIVDDTVPAVEEPVAEAPKSFLAEEKAEDKEDDSNYMVRSFVTEDEAQDSVDKQKFERKQGKKKKEKKRKKLRTYQQRQNILGYAFMAPWIIGFLAFTLFPFVATIFLSFTNVKQGVRGFIIEFNGINNYITAFVKNSSFSPALIEYIKVIVPYTAFVVIISFIIAYLLNKVKTGKGVLRTIYFLPVIIMSGPVMNQITAVDEAMQKAAEISGLTVVNDYSNIFIMQIIESYSPQISLFLGSIFDQLSLILWFTGIPIVLFINALQKINVSIYEAAKIDSANSWQIMWKITIPMLRSIGMIVTIFTVIQLGMYDTINPVYQLIIDATGDTNGGLGYAATYAWIYSAIVLVIILVIFLLFREKKGKRGA